MDPWLCGPAFLGAWIQYPPPVVNVSTLQPDAIVITHEHSDHFHEPTLRHFDRATPVYVPDFPNRRLLGRLTALGFTHIHPMAFGQTYTVSAHCTLACFEPGSVWNDAMVLVEIDGFRLLNINDAGLNQRIAALVAPVDAVASQFSIGASGYPLTWSHLTAAEKLHIMERACQGKLHMLQEAMQLYRGKYLLPIASHFALWHPTHREYVCMMRTNTLDDVVGAFAGSEVEVIDLLPGELWDVSAGRRTRVEYRREPLHDLPYKLQYLERRFNSQVFQQHHPVSGDLTAAEVQAYFLRLNDVPEMAFCEDLTVRVRASGGNTAREDVDVAFQITGGRLRVLPALPPAPGLLIELPPGVLQRIVTENLSWDEGHLGYWCRFTRTLEMYHAGFWRVLQAPYFRRPVEPPAVALRPITGDSVIADVVETHGHDAERILRRYGLYCAGCHHSPSESLAQGARAHGLEGAQIHRLVRELNEVFCPTR
jgi:CMP-N-acetylneuraminate monooxygenase